MVAATLIRTFCFRSICDSLGFYGKTLLVKDFLFVSKLSYGPRIPNTPLSFPFVHNYMPVTNGKSYSELIKLPYIRWFASEPKRGDVVVFNFPGVIPWCIVPSLNQLFPIMILFASSAVKMSGTTGLNRLWYTRSIKPTTTSTPVAAAGDTLQIINGDVFINGKPAIVPPYSARKYNVTLKQGFTLDKDHLEELGIMINETEGPRQQATCVVVLRNTK